MTLEKALLFLREGKKIRRAFWPDGVYLVKGKTPYNVLKIWVDENGVAEPLDYATFYASDLLKDDWEIIE